MSVYLELRREKERYSKRLKDAEWDLKYYINNPWYLPDMRDKLIEETKESIKVWSDLISGVEQEMNKIIPNP